MLSRNPLPLEWTEPAAQDIDGIVDYLLGERLPFDAVEDQVKPIYQAPEHLATLSGAGKPGGECKAPGNGLSKALPIH